jgi:hypothetical protein
MARSRGDQARQALQRYLERCRAATVAAGGKDGEALDSALRLVREAFHNFCAADHAALLEGEDITKDTSMRAILRESDRAREVLMGAVSGAKMRTLGELAKVRQSMTIRNFRSSAAEPMFEHKV